MRIGAAFFSVHMCTRLYTCPVIGRRALSPHGEGPDYGFRIQGAQVHNPYRVHPGFVHPTEGVLEGPKRRPSRAHFGAVEKRLWPNQLSKWSRERAGWAENSDAFPTRKRTCCCKRLNANPLNAERLPAFYRFRPTDASGRGPPALPRLHLEPDSQPSTPAPDATPEDHHHGSYPSFSD